MPKRNGHEWHLLLFFSWRSLYPFFTRYRVNTSGCVRVFHRSKEITLCVLFFFLCYAERISSKRFSRSILSCSRISCRFSRHRTTPGCQTSFNHFDGSGSLWVIRPAPTARVLQCGTWGSTPFCYLGFIIPPFPSSVYSHIAWICGSFYGTFAHIFLICFMV